MSGSQPMPPAAFEVVPGRGRAFTVDAGTAVVSGDLPEEIGAAVRVAEVVTTATDVPVMLGTGRAGPGTIAVWLDPSAGSADEDPAERYSVRVTAHRVEIRAPRPAGLERAAEALGQLLVRQDDGTVTLPAVTVRGAPHHP